MKKVLNIALLITFVLTVMVPLTGIQIHKLASCLFLLLSILHTFIYRKKLGTKKYLLLALAIVCFATGLLGMILNQYPIIMILHRSICILAVFFFAIHIFVYRKKLR